MFSPRRMFAVTKKEFQELIRNWMGFLLSIIAPVILFFLFAYGMPLDVKNIPMAVMDEDKSEYSRRFIDLFKNSKIFEIKQYAEDYKTADNIIRAGNIRVCLIIPLNFAKKIHEGRPQSVQALVDATYTNRASIIGGYIEAVIASFNEEILSRFFAKHGAGHAKEKNGMPVDIYISPWFNPSMRSDDFIVPGVIGIILIFLPPIIAAISLSKEKETGSILNMYCSPISKTEYILGKAVPYIALTFFNFFLYLIFTMTIFRVPLRGDPVLLIVVSLIYIITIIGIGFFIATLVNTQIAAILIVAVVTLIPSFMYSGFMLPVICMDKNAQAIAQSIPPTYYIDFIRKLMLKGVGINYLARDIIALIIIGVILYALAIAVFKKRLE